MITEREYQQYLESLPWYRNLTRYMDTDVRESLWIDNYRSFPDEILAYAIVSIEENHITIPFALEMRVRMKALLDERIHNLLLG